MSDVPGWDWTSSTEDAAVRVDLQPDRPHSARMYDYYLGGKDNFPADREAAQQALAEFPHGRTTAGQNRAFMHRAIRYLAGEVGIRQFLDIGTGIPTSPNLHEVAQQIAPDARVVYADNDPIVLVHARALLTGTPTGRTAYLDADLRDVEAILASAELRETIDLTQPVAVSLVAILHFFPDADDPYGVVQRLLDALPSGSHVVISHVTGDYAPETWTRLIETYRGRGIPAQARSHGEIARLFEGLDLVEPGIQVAHRWRPDAAVPAGLTDAEVSVYGGVGRKK
ncbi:SAM-dependent methyltransferase [Pseudofrankia sp. BMG5.36]|uniref:SAM-dependent methyltransferase n=1 Tax=Pseudofrankia sp. BMG5.36 TaxID=1834512 RepID=UPI0008D9979F|nr:SAM-dependent methyltransferase [Pseudofrankia sp. BMG5.36]OHV47148.1 methyltransferase [Pseudofrankia sp. BMG5.36]